MILFAGIHEVTKELDDLACYNFKNKTWHHMFKEPPMEKPLIQNPLESSPTKLNKTINNNMNNSPLRSVVSPNKKGATLGQKTET